MSGDKDELAQHARYGDHEGDNDFESARHSDGGGHDEEEEDDRERDEEAQLLDGEDYEQFELEDASPSAPLHRQRPDERTRARERDGDRRRRTPRSWLTRFLHGPSPPKTNTIRPRFPSVQEYPVRLLDRLLPQAWQKLVLLALSVLLWTAALAIPLAKSKGALTDAAGNDVRHLDCVDTLWRRNNECGLDGLDCRPFANETFSFRCPANCAGVRVLNPHHVGPVDVNYRPLVIGGPVYRGDSFVCGAAIHAGVISDASGGCGTVALRGTYYGFFGSSHHGIDSIGFDSYFPLSFAVGADPALDCGLPDPRKPLLLVSLLFTVTLSLLATSSPLLFYLTFTSVFAHVALLSDPPAVSGPSSTIFPTLVSLFAGRLLPALFCASILYLTIIKHTLSSLPPTANATRTLLWLLPLWLGTLSNDTLSWIPLSRLSAHDLAQQPGARAALAVILLVLVLAVANQTYHFWREGRLLPHLALYLVLLLAIAAAAALPGLELRIHHYVLALLLLPLTATQTRPSLLFQGFLLGLFVNGIARWGFDSLLQTPGALRDDAALNSRVPVVVPPLIYLNPPAEFGGHKGGVDRIQFKWAPPEEDKVEGISVLVNDVERYRGFFKDGGGGGLDQQVFTWTRDRERIRTAEYFRFGFVGAAGAVLDYGEAGTWFANGSWSQGEGYYRG
ncbi:hypothetical protein B0T22DRAFT_179323 [Podospora appendiculata]|uniref:LCCL domain-containing protein n=1 Tax=Podospora appendiculata TaxID=314037 RepID=A0AAE1CDR6_9PEZI|nr:hypothetical protein B0T22DRAFT_179323 [Podospora appendiculata]